MEEIYPGNREILLSLQAHERYPTWTAIDVGREETINRDAKVLGGITSFSAEQTPVYKWCMSRYWLHNIYVTFQGMIIKTIILAETIL